MKAFDTQFLNKEPQPWEYRSKPIWQRMIDFRWRNNEPSSCHFIFWGIIFHEGRTIRPITEIGYVTPNSPASKSGLHIGDKIISINNHPMKQWDEIESTLYTESVTNDLTIQVQRSGTVNTIQCMSFGTTRFY